MMSMASESKFSFVREEIGLAMIGALQHMMTLNCENGMRSSGLMITGYAFCWMQ